MPELPGLRGHSSAASGQCPIKRVPASCATYVFSVRRLAVLLIVSNFVEVVLVELPHKTSKVAVLEVLRQYRFREFLVL